MGEFAFTETTTTAAAAAAAAARLAQNEFTNHKHFMSAQPSIVNNYHSDMAT
jgi:hypothetical protein